MLNIPGVELRSVDDMPKDYGRWLIHGPQGAGKTTLASTIAELGKTLFVDFVGEKGTRSFQGAPYAKNITIARPQSITALDDLFYALNGGDHDYSCVVLDSLSAIQKMAMRYLQGHDETAVREIKQGSKPADFQTWGRALDIMQDTATFWYGLADGDRERPMHVVMTAQTKIIEDEISGTVTRVPDVQKGALSMVLAACDYAVYADLEENMDAASDPSLPPMNHILRFGDHPDYRTKARVPRNLPKPIPPILGRTKPVSLATLSRHLAIGGTTAPAKAA